METGDDAGASPRSLEAENARRINTTEVQNMNNKYMTPRQVAQELEVSAATVVRWVRDGTIPAKRFGRRIIKIPRTEVERMLNY